MGFESIIGAGASLLGGAMQSDAASDAADAQARASREANDLQRYIYDNNVRLNQPAIDAGNLGRNRLLQLLGLGGTPGGQSAESRDQLRSRMVGQFTRNTPGTPAVQAPTFGRENGTSDSTNYAEYLRALYAGELEGRPGSSTIDETGLQAAIDAEMARNSGIDSSAGDYGSLMRDFTGADLQNEPGYQFGLAEGQKGLDRRAAAGGGYFSGAALKAANRFGQDYAGTKFNEAFNRDTANKTNKFNRLTSLTGGGQTAANQTQAAGTNYANTVGGNITAMGNAQGASNIAQGNAWQNALTGAVDNYQQNNIMNSLLKNMGRTRQPYDTPGYGMTGGYGTMGFGGEY